MNDKTQADRKAATPGRPQPEKDAARAAATILVVEDDDRLRRLVVRQMAELGYQVLEAADGGAALAVIDRCPVDLLFTDVVMPGGVDGPGLARTAAARRPGLRVLFTTGFSATMTDSDGQIEDGVMLLTKPYRKEDLARALTRAFAG